MNDSSRNIFVNQTPGDLFKYPYFAKCYPQLFRNLLPIRHFIIVLG